MDGNEDSRAYATELLRRFRSFAAAYERRSQGIGSHWPFESRVRFLPEHTPAVSLLHRAPASLPHRHHPR